jgi:hypothetical protein
MIVECTGDLDVQVWDAATIEFETDAPLGEVGQEGDTLYIARLNDDARLRLPVHTELHVERVRGDADVTGIRAASFERVSGDLDLREIGGAVQLGHVSGDLHLASAAALTVDGTVNGDVDLREIAGDARLAQVDGDLEVVAVGALAVQRRVGGSVLLHDVPVVKLDRVDGNLEANDVQSLTVRAVVGNCELKGVGEAVRYGNIAGNLEVSGEGHATVTGGAVAGDLDAADLASVQCGSVGGDAELRSIGGAVAIGSVGGDAELRELHGDLQLGQVGGDLELEALFPPESTTSLVAGGDVRIVLPDTPNLSIRATVRGEISGDGLVSRGGAGLVTIVFGEGSAQLRLAAGGDLELVGGGSPRMSSVSSGEWKSFEREMEHLGEEIGRMGEEIGRSIAAAMGTWGAQQGEDWSKRAERIHERAAEKARWAEERAHRAAERGDHRAADAPQRVRVRINDREWVFDRERVERLKNEARRAAREGIAGALQAIERAFAGMGVPPEPPEPPKPPHPDAPPAPERPYPATGQTVKIELEPDMVDATPGPRPAPQTEAPGEAPAGTITPATPTELEEQRAAIVRMVAEGRITPEEGDMLLDALGA